MNCLRDEQLKNDIHSSAASYDLVRNIFVKALFTAKCNDLICDLLTGQASRP